MVWTEPKTDWHGQVNADGVYEGDRFNASDYNRIKNNLVILHLLANALYREFGIQDVGADKGVSDYPYADEINKLEENLRTINAASLKLDCGDTMVFRDNGKFIEFRELNRIESACLSLYSNLTNEYAGRRMLAFNFGMKGGL